LTVFDAARILFWGYTAAAGYEPWVSDGTSAGTFMLRDIYTGTTTSRTSSAWSINVFDGVAYYWAAANAEFELWKTDGTSVGTVMTVDALAGQSNSGGRLWKFNNLLYYAGQCAGNSVTGVELCSYNPSTNTFALVKDIWPGTISGMTVDPITDDAGPSVPAVVVGSKFYFMGYTATHSQELWQSDGTSAGTVETKDINTRSTSGNTYSSNTKWFIPFRSGFLFSATTNGGSQANQPYFSDGTSVGTVSLEPPTNSNDGAYSGYTDSNMTSITFGAYTYFTSQIVGGGTTLFRTDGTTAGTTQLSSNLIGTNIGFGGLGRAGNYILMSASNGASGWEMYTYNTSTNASGFIDIVSGTTGTSPSSYFSFGNKALFLATTSAAGNELWITDGTAAGTSMVKDIEPGAGSSGVAKPSWYELNGRVYFWASTANNGIELWRTDGTSAGTEMFVETNSGAYNGNSGLLTVGSMASIGNNLVVCADDGTNGYEVRSIDTTATAPATQTMIKSLASFSTNGCIRGVTKFGNNVLFVGNNLTSNYELWITDGTAAGTTQVREINTSSAAFNTFGNMGDRDGHFVVANGTAYFSALSSGIEYKLWKTDGTSSGTVEVSNVPTIVNNAGATIFGMGGRVYFSGNTAEAGYEPWVSDGTSAGTFLIANLMAGKNPSNPAFFSETPSGKVFFMAKGTKVGIEPYLYDPTVAADGMAASATTTTMGASTTTTTATTSTSTTATTSSSTSTTLVAPTTTQAAATTSTPKLNLDPWELAELDDTVAEAPLVNVPAPKVLPVQEETLVTARPGTALAVVDGRVVHPTVKVGNAVIKVTVGGTTAVAVVRDTKGNALPLSEQHIILLTRGQVFDLRASGLRPNEIADLWIYSTPQFLGRATANQMGQLRTQFIVSKNVVLGAHHIVVSIKTKSGSELSIAFAANVIDKPSRFPVLASPVLWFALALGLIAYVIGRRRRSSELH
jgi:ELWxxDGT repeat protein